MNTLHSTWTGPAYGVSNAAHDEITARHRALEKTLAGLTPTEAAKLLTQTLRNFDEVSRVDREQLLKTGLLKTRPEQATCAWIAGRYGHLLRLARECVLRTFADDNPDIQPRAAICALAIVLSGHAIKWRTTAGSRPDTTAREWLHEIFRTAVAFGVDATVLSVRIEDRQIDANVEALYVRALLLDRFSSGNLPPKRLEILDTWLIEWMGALWLTRVPVAGEPTLGVNTNVPQRGLTPYAPGDGAHLFLSLRPLQRQLARSLREFHHGVIFPGWGIGMGAAMEDHVAVIDFLEREFTLIEAARKQRSKRMAIGLNSPVGVFFGFEEICRMAFSPEKLHSLAGGGTEIGIRNAIQLIDISEGGLGLDMVEDDARHVHVDDLLAIRLEKGRPCVLGVVVRKSSLQKPSATLIGVKVLSKAPVFVAMDRVDEATNMWQPTEGILITGTADDGFADSVIVSDKTYVANSLLAVTLEARTYELYLRRVRQQGIGWRMAAFDATLAP
ncbi:MAG: hypothetical protein IPP88_06845 [Betaproteobacteria bacterium]|nr:hypothetical protein [Betaproteobacteria bacterium]